MNVASFAVSAAAIVVSVVVAISTAIRAQYERVLNVLDYLSDNDVALARHRLGSIIHRGRTPGTTEEANALVASLFTVLWAFGRVDAVRRSLSSTPWPLHGPRMLLRSSVEPWVTYWTIHVDQIADELDADIHGADQGLRGLTDAWRVDRSTERAGQTSDTAPLT